jgi:hypothetical protein
MVTYGACLGRGSLEVTRSSGVNAGAKINKKPHAENLTLVILS